MSTIHPDDPLLDAIGALPRVGPDAGPVERVRKRCHGALCQPAMSHGVSFEPVTIGTICAIYAWHVVRIAAQIPRP